MARAVEESPGKHPWIYPDALPHAVASAGWGERYPALCYELGESNSDGFVPHDIIRASFLQERFAVAVWQPNVITFVDVSHIPERTFMDEDAPDRAPVDWATIKRYHCAAYSAVFTSLSENIDPRVIMDDLYAILATPLGVHPGPQDILNPHMPITRLIIEYPDFAEDRQDIPLDTTIAALGGVSTQKYLNTIYSPPKV